MVAMNILLDKLLLGIVKCAILIGLGLGILCMVLSYIPNINSQLGSLFVNLAGDFFMAGLTIGVIDKLIKRSEQQKLGKVPEVARKAINNEVWKLIGILSFSVRDALKKDIQEIIDSDENNEISNQSDLLKKMRIVNLAQLSVIDEKKLTLGMFSDMLRFVQQTLTHLDDLISRYNVVLSPEQTSRAIELRNTLEGLGSGHTLVTLTIPFFGRQTPDVLLDKRQRNVFMSMNKDISDLIQNLM